MTDVASIAVSGAGITGGTGDLNAGHTVTFTVNMTSPVTVTGGIPSLWLNDLGIAFYDAAHSTANALAFSYTVQTGQNTADLAVTAVHLNGAAIRDGAATDANLSGAVTNPAGTLQIDTTGPQILSFVATDPLQTNASVVHYTLTFSEPVTGNIAGDLTLHATGVTGAHVESVTAVGGSGGAQYIIAVDTGSGDGTVALDLMGTDIRDLAGNALPGGTFKPQSVYAAGGFVAIADLNGDGRLDLATSNFRTVSVLLGNGDGTFKTLTTYATGGQNSLSMAVGDVNGDHKPDLVTANSESADVSVLLGNGDGTFGTQTTFAAPRAPHSIQIGDFNGDGKLDLAVAETFSVDFAKPNSVSVLLGNGDGSFQPRVDYLVEAGPVSVAIGDLNSDGKPDLAVMNFIAVVNFNSETVSVLLGNGDGTFQPQVPYATQHTSTSVAIADVNGDGRQDLVTADNNSNSVSVFLGNGDGTVQPLKFFAAGINPLYVAVGDLNGDSKPDLVVTNEDSKTVSTLFGNGDGTYQSPTAYATGSFPFNVAIGDLNGDGRPDIVGSNFYDGTVSVLLNEVAKVESPTYAIVKPVTGPSEPATVPNGYLGPPILATATAAGADHTASVAFDASGAISDGSMVALSQHLFDLHF